MTAVCKCLYYFWLNRCGKEFAVVVKLFSSLSVCESVCVCVGVVWTWSFCRKCVRPPRSGLKCSLLKTRLIGLLPFNLFHREGGRKWLRWSKSRSKRKGIYCFIQFLTNSLCTLEREANDLHRRLIRPTTEPTPYKGIKVQSPRDPAELLRWYEWKKYVLFPNKGVHLSVKVSSSADGNAGKRRNMTIRE